MRRLSPGEARCVAGILAWKSHPAAAAGIEPSDEAIEFLEWLEVQRDPEVEAFVRSRLPIPTADSAMEFWALRLLDLLGEKLGASDRILLALAVLEAREETAISSARIGEILGDLKPSNLPDTLSRMAATETPLLDETPKRPGRPKTYSPTTAARTSLDEWRKVADRIQASAS